MADKQQCVLILGGGINGAAIARELAINGVPVAIVESADLAFGATAYSSRLIHGGLRYLEYGEFDLVRESLAERTRLLKLAPQFVRPLELFIPVESRLGGLLHSAARFTGLERWFGAASRPRGLWLVEAGLWLYDRYARDPSMPRHRAWRRSTAEVPPVDEQKYRWLCSYFDAQIRFPERFVIALLADAQAAAAQHGELLEVRTYHHARLRGQAAEIVDRATGEVVRVLEPAAIVNATGAWVDLTLQQLGIPSRPLMAGTKGSHLVTYNQALHRALAGRGLYAEAADGRPVFVLPFGPACLIGTTDLPYSGDPADAVTSPAEIDYLLSTANGLFPQVGLAAGDVELHYCGVRPLPATSSTTTAGITRRHWVQEHSGAPIPLFSVIGGKLTTCRSLAEQTVGLLLERLSLPHVVDSRERFVPGGEDYPADESALADYCQAISRTFGLRLEQVRQLWPLWGTRLPAVLAEVGAALQPAVVLPGTNVPCSLAAWVIEHEHVRHLGDLVERRLMLLYDRGLSRACLEQLADLLVTRGLLAPTDRQRAIDDQQRRLKEHFGKELD